ncbi:MAG: hypothetical protein ACYDAQ_05055 [Mycobacteriales bacterium]
MARWDCVEIARELVARGIVVAISSATVRRWLAEEPLRPWQHRSWIFPRDPDFAIKAGRMLDLYARTWQSRELRESEFVVSTDREDLGPTPVPMPSHLAGCEAPEDPGRARIRARRVAGLPGLLRRAPGQGHRPL